MSNFPNAWIGFPPVCERGNANKKRTAGKTFWIPFSAKRCGTCNCRIRGENHKDGPHHHKVNLRK